MSDAIEMIRPFWTKELEQYHKDIWKSRNITVLVCQRNTKDLIKLCLESLFRFYPDIPVLVVDDNSTDESLAYLKLKVEQYNNLSVFCRKSNYHSHGVMLHEATVEHITTKYVLMMDSDVIIERGGFIEDMLLKMEDSDVFAVGTNMIVSNAGDACAPPKNAEDELRYAHPSFSIFNRELYIKLNTPYTDHGAPCVYTMKAVQKNNLKIVSYPVDKFVSHLSGASWCVPKTIWNNDHNVFVRPLVTFLVSDINKVNDIKNLTFTDYNIIILKESSTDYVVVHDDGVHHNVNNNKFRRRFDINGEYVCEIGSSTIINNNVIDRFVNNISEIVDVEGCIFYERKYWQRNVSML